MIDALPEDRSAMIWLGASGEERHLTFGDFSRMSNKVAGALRELGIERGDLVMVPIGKVPKWHATLIGLLKLGAIAIPSAPQLRANDLQFRMEHSGAKAIISDAESAPEVEKIREEVPGLEQLVLLGEEREGWKSYEKLVDDAPEEFTVEDTASDEGAFLLHTSGTTKQPRRAPPAEEAQTAG